MVIAEFCGDHESFVFAGECDDSVAFLFCAWVTDDAVCGGEVEFAGMEFYSPTQDAQITESKIGYGVGEVSCMEGEPIGEPRIDAELVEGLVCAEVTVGIVEFEWYCDNGCDVRCASYDCSADERR